MSYAEYQHDTYMKQSDYKKLREILGLQSVELDPSLCYIHCVPAFSSLCATFAFFLLLYGIYYIAAWIRYRR